VAHCRACLNLTIGCNANLPVKAGVEILRFGKMLDREGKEAR
jgi:hypothetical protein